MAPKVPDVQSIWRIEMSDFHAMVVDQVCPNCGQKEMRAGRIATRENDPVAMGAARELFPDAKPETLSWHRRYRCGACRHVVESIEITVPEKAPA